MSTDTPGSLVAAGAPSALLGLQESLPLVLPNSAAEILWIADAEKRYRFLSPNVEAALGVSPRDLLDASPIALLTQAHPEDAARALAAYRELVEKGAPYSVELRFRRPDGRWIWIHDRAIGVHAVDGEVTVYGILSDVTEARRTAQLHAGQRRTMELIAKHAPLEESLTCLAHIIEENADGLLCSVLVYDQESQRLVLGAAPSLPAEYRAATSIVPVGPRVGSCGTAAWRRERVIVADIAGDPLWVDYAHLALAAGLRACWSEPILSSRGHLLGTFALYYREVAAPAPPQLHLISAAAHLAGVAIEGEADKRAITRARDAAEASNRFKSEFLATMSHEIRTPMTAILGYTDLLLETENSAEEVRASLQVIRQNGNHLLAILNDILDLSKIEAGMLHIEHLRFSLAELITDVRDLFKAAAQAKGIELELEFGPDLPAKVVSDPTRARQVLVNLVGNAIKFTQAGSVLVRTNRIAVPGNDVDRVCIEVVDTGPGMTPEARALLFVPYSQTDRSVSRKHGGTGLGLAISKRLAQLLGGDLVVQTFPGEGSSFHFILDQRADDTPRADIAGSHRPRGEAPCPCEATSHGRVLLVEDVAVNQKIVAHYLRKAGFECTLAENGRKGVDAALAARAAGRAFDVIFMDTDLPELDGRGAVIELRARGYRGAIVALTPGAEASDGARCVEAGCDGFLGKPVLRRELLAAATRHCAARTGAAK